MAKILVVDDSYIMRMKIKTMLTNAGHDVVGEASNGEQAIIEYTQKQPDIVTMDISMPVMDGVSALRMIMSKFPRARVIVISALEKKNMVLTALDSGARNYLLKPIDEVKLMKVIDNVLKDDKPPKKLWMNGDTTEEEEAIAFDLETEIKTPFSIDNKSGTLVINIGKTLHAENFSALSNAVQGLLFIKPLSIIINFGKVEDLEEELLEGIKKMIASIKAVNGSVKLAAASDIIREKLTGSMSSVKLIEI
jgi:DNA-binding NarL/FixJ family response regulator